MTELRPHHALAGKVGPSWFRVGRNLAVLWAIFVHLDLLIDMLVAAVRRTFTGAQGCLADGIHATGAEVGIRRGPGESLAVYAERVRKAHVAIAHKGNPVVLLRQIREYFAAWAIFPVEFITPYGYRITLNTDGSVTRDTVTPDVNALAAGRTSSCRLFFRPTVALPSTRDDVRALVADWLAGHVRLRAAAVFNGAHVWGEPGLLWGQDGLVWNIVEPMTFEVNV
jgi:hypothetical protein